MLHLRNHISSKEEDICKGSLEEDLSVAAIWDTNSNQDSSLEANPEAQLRYN